MMESPERWFWGFFVDIVLNEAIKKDHYGLLISTQCGQMQFRINPYLNSPCKLQDYCSINYRICQ